MYHGSSKAFLRISSYLFQEKKKRKKQKLKLEIKKYKEEEDQNELDTLKLQLELQKNKAEIAECKKKQIISELEKSNYVKMREQKKLDDLLRAEQEEKINFFKEMKAASRNENKKRSEERKEKSEKSDGFAGEKANNYIYDKTKLRFHSEFISNVLQDGARAGFTDYPSTHVFYKRC